MDRPIRSAARAAVERRRPEPRRASGAPVLALLLVLLAAGPPGAGGALAGMPGAGGALAESDARRFEPQRGVLWQPYQSWSLAAGDVQGNPFDVVAIVTFAHDGSGARHVTHMFYAGDGRWEFRFTGTRTGRWRFATASEEPQLDGWSGEVLVDPNPDPAAHGSLRAVGTRFAVPIDEHGTLAGRLYNVYMNAGLTEMLHGYPRAEPALSEAIDTMLSEVEEHGMDAMFVIVLNNWFELGSPSHRDHDGEDPSLEAFELLERLILEAHARGLGVHIWQWGDEQRRWTQVGVGGINGIPDRRLQRYIAARLGPLPGWTMSYGFDLHEWVTPAEVRSWWSYMHAHLGWPRLLMARETRAARPDPERVFELDAGRLDVFSSDERPQASFFDEAVRLLAASELPILFERRFLHTRDRVWDMDVTRRALWQFTMAGGAGAVWGVMWGGAPPYPEPAQLRTHGDFWRTRASLALTSPRRVGGAHPGYALHDQAGKQAVFYAEATSQLGLDLSAMDGPQPAVAVDTLAPYQPLDIGPLEPVDQLWQAPYASDWAVAVGAF
jgi:hypothetical protein